MKKAKHLLAFLLTAALCLALVACGSPKGNSDSAGAGNNAVSDSTSGNTDAQPVEVVVFAAASMEASLTEIADLYKEVAPNVTLIFTFESSGTLRTQIKEGARCV